MGNVFFTRRGAWRGRASSLTSSRLRRAGDGVKGEGLTPPASCSLTWKWRLGRTPPGGHPAREAPCWGNRERPRAARADQLLAQVGRVRRTGLWGGVREGGTQRGLQRPGAAARPGSTRGKPGSGKPLCRPSGARECPGPRLQRLAPDRARAENLGGAAKRPSRGHRAARWHLLPAERSPQQPREPLRPAPRPPSR